jgi:hypothetical protein
MKSKLGHKEQEIMDFLHENVFDPILASPRASVKLGDLVEKKNKGKALW